jgi:hypothetical protein
MGKLWVAGEATFSCSGRRCVRTRGQGAKCMLRCSSTLCTPLLRLPVYKVLLSEIP